MVHIRSESFYRPNATPKTLVVRPLYVQFRHFQDWRSYYSANQTHHHAGVD